MYNKIPIFANKIYTKTSDHQDLYEQYNSMIGNKDPEYIEEEIFILFNKIYWDFVNNGFGSDWSKDYDLLVSDLEDIKELSNLISYLDTIKKYSRGYKVDDHETLQISEDLELVMCDILDYIDKVEKWTKIKIKPEW